MLLWISKSVPIDFCPDVGQVSLGQSSDDSWKLISFLRCWLLVFPTEVNRETPTSCSGSWILAMQCCGRSRSSSVVFCSGNSGSCLQTWGKPKWCQKKYYFPPQCLLQKSQVNNKHRSLWNIFIIYFKCIWMHAEVLRFLLLRSHRNVDTCRVAMYLVLREIMLTNLKLLLGHCL